MKAPLISIILPVYDQVDHIREVIEDYESELKRIRSPHEIIVVVNGCSSTSLAEYASLIEEYSSVKIIHSEKRGWGRAVKMGLSFAQGEILCYTNSARTNSEDLVLILLYALAYQGVVVKATRKIRESIFRRLGSLIYNLECRSLFNLMYWDINGTPKIFPRTFSALLELTHDNDLIDLEFNLICCRENYPMLEVPIFSSRRHGGRSTTTLRTAIKLYWGALRLWRETKWAEDNFSPLP